MVGQSEAIQLTHIHQTIKYSGLNLRELVLLTLDLVKREMTITELHTFTKNLEIRIRSKIEFKVPNLDIFTRLIHKFVKQGTLNIKYSLKTNTYIVTYTEMGEGEIDSLYYSLVDDGLMKILEEYSNLVSYAL